MKLTPEEFLALIAGELCACGHTREQHLPPGVSPVEGLEETMGCCVECSCAGMVEPVHPDE